MLPSNPSERPAAIAALIESGAELPDESEIGDAVATLLAAGQVHPGRAFIAGIRVLRRDAAVSRALEAASSDDVAILDAAISDPAFAEAWSRPLGTTLLRSCLCAALDVEAALTRWRRRLLLAALDGTPCAVPLDTLVSLAVQCWLNEFVFAEPNDEALAVDGLAARLTAAPRPHDIAIVAAYRALDPRVPAPDPALAPIVEAHFEIPAKERELMKTIVNLGAVAHGTSRAVRAQYEQHPYPRWRYCQRRAPRRTQDLMSSLATAYGAVAIDCADDAEVLVAGCGTGVQVIQCATQFSGARITGLDLSRPSLAVAARKARELGLANLSLAAGDILHLESTPAWRNRFAYIECVGVLHHMEAPAKGLAALAACLKPGGLLYIGLYSATARISVAAARETIAHHRLPPSLEGIRQFRAMVGRAVWRPTAATAALVPLVRFIDFYSTSMCRDLAFHVEEHGFDPRGVAALAAGAGLTLLGFNIADPRLASAYATAHPHDPWARDPERLAAFELANPKGFAGMYLCMLQKPPT